MSEFKKTKLYRIITGSTRTKQVSGASSKIVISKDLSKDLYSKLDKSKNFTVKAKDGKSYNVKQLVPSR